MPAPPLRSLPAALVPPITDGEIARLLIEERDAMDAAARRLAALIDFLRARERAPFSRETGPRETQERFPGGARRADEGESRA